MKTEKEIAIANPIYDVVFKYLMEDTEIAKLILSTIIDEEIESLDFLPQENILMPCLISFSLKPSILKHPHI